MAGGIQPGTEAGSIESKKLDGDIKRVAEAIADYIEKNNVPNAPYFEKGHKNLIAESFSEEKRQSAALPELAEMGISLGCMPDGGMWFDGDRTKQDRKLLAVFEAKHQQDGGNAIERWCKNYMLSKGINPEMTYHTLMSGEGAAPGGVLDKFSNSMTAANGDHCVFHRNVDGFSEEEICNIMTQALGLASVTYDNIKPHIGAKVSRFYDFFEEEQLTPEEIVEQTKAKQWINQLDDQFVKLLQTETSPLSKVWAKIDREDKVDAKEIAIEMLQADAKIGEIADILRDLFIVQ